jgi:hypothetical protein
MTERTFTAATRVQIPYGTPLYLSHLQPLHQRTPISR